MSTLTRFQALSLVLTHIHHDIFTLSLGKNIHILKEKQLSEVLRHVNKHFTSSKSSSMVQITAIEGYEDVTEALKLINLGDLL